MKRTMVCLTITFFLTGCILKSPTRALAQAERIELYGAYNSGLTFNQLVEYITELKPEEIAPPIILTHINIILTKYKKR